MCEGDLYKSHNLTVVHHTELNACYKCILQDSGGKKSSFWQENKKRAKKVGVRIPDLVWRGLQCQIMPGHPFQPIFTCILFLCVQYAIIFQNHEAVVKALAEDPSVFEYDNIYDDLQEKKKKSDPRLQKKDTRVNTSIRLIVTITRFCVCLCSNIIVISFL